MNAEEDPPWSPSRRKRGVRVTTAAVAALGLALAGASVAGAASSTTQSPSSATGSAAPTNRPPGGGSPPAAVGTVKSVGTDSFTISTQDGTTVTVDVSGSTTYSDHDASSPSLTNVTVGEHVAVFGSDSANVVTATSVAIGAPPAGPGGAQPGPGGGSPPAAVGTVKSVGTDSFTITTQDGTTVTVDVSGSTTYRDHGDASSPSLTNVTVGEHVAVFGSDSANVVAATSVAIGAPPAGAPGGAPGSKSGSTPSGTPPAWSGSGPPS